MEQIIAKAWEVRKANFPDEIEFDIPTKTKAISVTGAQCKLKCAHCNGHYLSSMIAIPEWQQKLTPDVTSCLISGGCDEQGKVPVLRYLPLLKQIKSSGLKTNLHVGLLDETAIEPITQLADAISFDFVGDNETIQEVYGLDKTVDDYVSIFKQLNQRAKVLPHVCIGLRGGQISGEYKALELLKELDIKGLVFIVFIPTAGTPYADRQPPSLEAVIQVIAQARLIFPNIPIHLGCMRPKGKYRLELDQLALRCGVNKIVQPTSKTIRLAAELGLKVNRREECCVL